MLRPLWVNGRRAVAKLRPYPCISLPCIPLPVSGAWRFGLEVQDRSSARRRHRRGGIDQGVRTLEAVGGAFGHSFTLSYGHSNPALAGRAAIPRPHCPYAPGNTNSIRPDCSQRRLRCPPGGGFQGFGQPGGPGPRGCEVFPEGSREGSAAPAAARTSIPVGGG